MHLNDILKTSSHTIIDVRSKEEFESGHVKGAINIPVNLIPEKIHEIENLSYPIILCCASGTRSRQAHIYLSQHGVANTFNGGSWLEINKLKKNN